MKESGGNSKLVRLTRLTIDRRKSKLEFEIPHFKRNPRNEDRRFARYKSELETLKPMPHDLFNALQSFEPNPGKSGKFYSLPQLEKQGIGDISKLPVSIRIVLESVLRNFDDAMITEDDVRAIAGWKPNAERTEEVPFVVARVLLQDFTGVPLLVDLAAMRSAVTRLNKNP